MHPRFQTNFHPIHHRFLTWPSVSVIATQDQKKSSSSVCRNLDLFQSQLGDILNPVKDSERPVITWWHFSNMKTDNPAVCDLNLEITR